MRKSGIVHIITKDLFYDSRLYSIQVHFQHEQTQSCHNSYLFIFFIMFGFREASLRDWNADTGAQSLIHLFYIVIGVR